jgi:hypothetical protein
MPETSPADRESDEEVEAGIARCHRREISACEELVDESFVRPAPWSGRGLMIEGERPSADEIIALELSRSLKSYRAN